MSGNNYYYYTPSTSSSYPDQQQQWSNWPQQQYVQTYRPMPPFHTPPPPINHVNTHVPPPRPHGYQQNNIPRHYAPRARYNNINQYNINPQQSWQRISSNYKRQRLDSTDMLEPKAKSSKKKKKPLSQNVPSKKDWTYQDAERALNMEKDYNKRNKNQSLIIKFPDLELSKEIVSKFHPKIENVHFQQPSTARFCFVTLQESANPDVVMNELNKYRFGDGFLSVEYKKDREEDQNLGPDDIDPLTLYVGNLAQEITKEEMVKTYPKSRRIDIGYAKKMKYTRYAFVTFKNINDSLEAFRQTHSTQLYSKSLIVRFRRLHGTVGMPGESKPQNPPKTKNDEINYLSETGVPHTTDLTVNDNEDRRSPVTSDINLGLVKKEPTWDEANEKKPLLNSDWVSPFLPGSVELAFTRHRPKIKTEIKDEVKTEKDVKPTSFNNSICNGIKVDSKVIKNELPNEVEIKQEPTCENEEDNYGVNYQEWYDDESEEDEDDDDEVINSHTTDLDALYANMVNHADMLRSLKKGGP